MSRAHKSPLRLLAVLAAVLMVLLSFGFAGTAAADPSAANGNAYAKGQADDQSSSQAASGNDQSSTKSDTTATSGNGKSTASDHKTKGTAATSGDVKSSQPIGGADDNTGGANGQCTGGVYCSTRDGSASGNGNGGGKATGKPCAGCVGKADNKNPQGQKPGPQDHNNGYECDGNNGIAKTNPAHTGCKSTTTTDCVPTKANQFCGQGEDCVPTKANQFCGNGDECVPGEGEMVNDRGECVPVCPTDTSIPMDDEDCNPSILPEEETPGSNRPPTVAGVEQFAGPQPPAAVEQFAGPSTAVGPSGILPSTGATTLMNALAATGLGLLLLGAATLVLRRKTQQV